MLVAELLGHVESAGEVGILDLFAYGETVGERWGRKTVENTVRDLAAFGAVRIVSRGRDRVVAMTVLGLAWLEGEILPGMFDAEELERESKRLVAERAGA